MPPVPKFRKSKTMEHGLSCVEERPRIRDLQSGGAVQYQNIMENEGTDQDRLLSLSLVF
jgi:hypothetical protein